jgi:hypothetical protein
MVSRPGRVSQYEETSKEETKNTQYGELGGRRRAMERRAPERCAGMEKVRRTLHLSRR